MKEERTGENLSQTLNNIFCDNWIGIEPLRCMECGTNQDQLDTIDYCDYKCTFKRIKRLGLERARAVHFV